MSCPRKSTVLNWLIRRGKGGGREWASVILVLAAVGLIVCGRVIIFQNPAAHKPDESSGYLDQYAETFKRIDKILETDVPLRYACPVGPEMDDWFKRRFRYIQAAIAPRRLSRTKECQYILLDFGNMKQLKKTPGIDNMYMIKRLNEGMALMEMN